MATPPLPPNPRLPRRALHGALRVLGRIELAVAVLAFIATCVIVSINATLRYGLNSSIVWSEEVALLCTSVFVFVGAAVIHKAGADVSVTLFVQRLPARTQAVLALATHAAGAAFFAVLLTQAIALWPLQWNTTTFILDISRFWFTVPLVYAATSMLATSIMFAVEAGHGLRAGLPAAPLRFVSLPAEPE